MFDPNGIGMPGTMIWFYGIVEDRMDPMHLGRVRVRCHGYHNSDKIALPVGGLPWAAVVLPVTSATNSGIGSAPVGPLEGTTVIGFFRDGLKAQEPVVMGTLPGLPKDKVQNTQGFNDPMGVYPKNPGSVSTNKLAFGGGHEPGQIHYLKDENRDLAVEKANTTLTWDQPPSPYQGQYPYNHVYQSEAGTVIEIDSSQESERFLLYMANGTFIEIDDNGQMVINVTDDEFHVNERSINMHIMGHQNVTVDGDASLYIKNAYEVQIDGNANIVCKNDVNLSVSGNLTTKVEGNMSTTVGGNYTLGVAGTVGITAGGTGTFQSKGALTINTGSMATIGSVGPMTVGSKATVKVVATTLASTEAALIKHDVLMSTPPGTSPTAPTAPGLERASTTPVVQNDNAYYTKADVDAVYTEPPNIGSGSTSKAVSKEPGATVPDLGSVTKDPTKTPPKVEPVVGSSFPKTYQLSNNFILGDLTSPKGGGNPEHFLRPQYNLTEAQIVTNLKNVAVNVLEPIVAKWGKSNLKILSGFRNGSGSSKHERGESVDIRFNNCNREDYPDRAAEVAECLEAANGFDGILLEYASGTTGPWIHIGYHTSTADNPEPIMQTYVNHRPATSGFESRG